MSIVVDEVPVPKAEHSELESFSDSSPEPDDPNFVQEVTQVQKRKGGRKPIYATSEERKQRNRQAQAAFRERRTEYIKQLEATIKHHEETLQSLQQSHRSAADECLMLRYKNSLLERVLLEKGIDVQAELKSRTQSSQISLTSAPPTVHQPSPIQRAVMNRHAQNRRSASGVTISPPNAHPSPTSGITKPSPRLQPTPPAQAISPIAAKPPAGLVQGGMTSPVPDMSAQQQQQPLHKPGIPPPQPPSISTALPGPNAHVTSTYSKGSATSNEMPSAASSQSTYYPSPFQTHIEQLEQEYDAHADMLDDQDPSDNSAIGPSYPSQFQRQAGQQRPPGQQGQPPLRPLQPLQPMQPMQPPPTTHMADGHHHTMNEMNQPFDPFDPMLDADPFGLTASMHFPTQFSFQESSMRQ